MPWFLGKLKNMSHREENLRKMASLRRLLKKYQKAIAIIDKHIALYPTERLRKALLYARIGYRYKNLNAVSEMVSAFQKAAKETEETAVDNPKHI